MKVTTRMATTRITTMTIAMMALTRRQATQATLTMSQLNRQSVSCCTVLLRPREKIHITVTNTYMSKQR